MQEQRLDEATLQSESAEEGSLHHLVGHNL